MSDAALKQRQDALAKANRVRLTRSAFKRELGEVGSRGEAWAMVADLLENPDPIFEGMRIGDLLTAGKWSGPSATRKILSHVGVLSLDVQIQHLTEARRERLATVLRAGQLPQAKRDLRFAA